MAVGFGGGGAIVMDMHRVELKNMGNVKCIAFPM
jgi:hypothetical protein